LLVICFGACGQDPVAGRDADTSDVGDVAPSDVDVQDTSVPADVPQETESDTGLDAIEDSAPADSGGDSASLEAIDGTDSAVDTADTATEETAGDTNDAADSSDTSDVDGACTGPDECTMCAFRETVTGPEDCYCVFCPSFPMTAAQCDANRASWERHCEPWPRPEPCPVAICLPSARPLCVEGACVPDPNACVWPEDCGTCRFASAPASADDCRCPTCPLPLAKDHCAEIEEAISIECTDFDFEACPVLPCPLPPPITCTEAYTCGYGDLTPRPEGR